MKNFELQNITRDSIKRLKPYSSARDEYVSLGSEMVFLDANENPNDNREVLLNSEFQPNTEIIQSNVDDNTKLLFLCSPNNPTGNLIDENKIETILSNFKGLVVIDEAYIDFANATSWIDRLNEFPNLVVTQTLSKAYGMAGIRLGMCFASEANLNKVANQVSEILTERGILHEKLKEITFIQNIYNSEANFILVQVDDADMRYNQILKAGIVIRNRSKQPLCENTLRFTIGTPEENIKLIKALKAIK